MHLQTKAQPIRQMLFRRIIRIPYTAAIRLLSWIPYFRFIHETQDNAMKITFEMWFQQMIIGHNVGVYWPVDRTTRVFNWRNIRVGVDSAPGYMPGCYIQGIGTIEIGSYTHIAPNCGLISANHDIYDCRVHHPSTLKIGDYCWIGMNSVVLPGTTLGDFTIVAAGSVVRGDFSGGYCVIAGAPAKIVKHLNPDECVRYQRKHQYHGYIRAADFESFCRLEMNPPFDQVSAPEIAAPIARS